MKTLRDILNQHLDYMRSLNFSKYTCRTYYYNITRVIDWFGERYSITTPVRLRVSHLHAWQKHASELTTRDGRPLKARSVNKLIENLRGFLDYMSRQGLVQARLLDGVKYVKEPKVLPGSVLTPSQMRRLLESVKPDSALGFCNRTMLETLYSTGIRVGELLGIDVDSVDLTGRTIRVLGKGSKERVVPVGKTALGYLESYIKAIRPHLLRDRAEKAMFLDVQGNRISYHVFRRRILKCAESADLDTHVTAHTFRRSCTTELLRGGAGMYHVKELLGHESLETLKHYAKLTIMDLKETHRRCHPREKDGG